MAGDGSLGLPPGFRFYPTDEELVVHFLHHKSGVLPFHPNVIPDLDVYPYDPWELQGKALSEGSKWYYYSRRIQTRNTKSGYWKSMDMDEPIMSSFGRKIVGMKKYFVFHFGEPPTGVWTNWIMYEYRLPDSESSSRSSSKRKGYSKQDHHKWVICKVYQQGSDDDNGDDNTELSCLDEVFLSMDDYDEITLPN